MMLAREQGVVRQLKIQKVKTTGGEAELQTLLELNREQTARLIDTVKLLDHIPIEGDDRTVVDDDVSQAVLRDPRSIEELYRQDKAQLRDLIQNDSSARDVVALATVVSSLRTSGCCLTKTTGSTPRRNDLADRRKSGRTFSSAIPGFWASALLVSC